MSWSIEISDASHEDLRDIYSYILYRVCVAFARKRSQCASTHPGTDRDAYGVVSVGRILYCKRNTDAIFANGWE